MFFCPSKLPSNTCKQLRTALKDWKNDAHFEDGTLKKGIVDFICREVAKTEGASKGKCSFSSNPKDYIMKYRTDTIVMCYALATPEIKFMLCAETGKCFVGKLKENRVCFHGDGEIDFVIYCGMNLQ